MTNTISNKTTFWEFMINHRIEVPIIQREFAFGRPDKMDKRKKFLNDLKEAIQAKNANDECKGKALEFIYGYVEQNKMMPLDGQQRLTVLWLVHWFIALKAGKLKENRDIFTHFSYNTRISAREFCKQLCEYELPNPLENNSSTKDVASSIAKDIESQKWFYSFWKQDPTVQSMLNLISGTTRIEKKDRKKTRVSNEDGIEQIFRNCKYGEYWKLLTSTVDKCPVYFYFLNLDGENLPKTDDLYIKMNARGKQLSDFENFKADLIDSIDDQSILDELPAKIAFASKIDNEWTKLFWTRKRTYKIKIENKEEERVSFDEIFFAFFNRYFLGLSLASGGNEGSETFKKLYGSKGDDNEVVYNGFSYYKNAVEKKDNYQQHIKYLYTILQNYCKYQDQIKPHLCPYWDEKNFSFFIPEYNCINSEESTFRPIGQKERCVFWAICVFLRNEFADSSFPEEAFKQWMHFVWNMAENSDINTIDSMRGLIMFFEEHAESVTEIRKYLRDYPIQPANNKSKRDRQFLEEIEKVKNRGNGDIYITTAEKLFKGAIRFLYLDDKGNPEWKFFLQKWTNAIRFFMGDDGHFIKKIKGAEFIKRILSFSTHWNSQIWWNHCIFSNNEIVWKENILLREEFFTPVHRFLLNEGKVAKANRRIDNAPKKVMELLCDTKLLDYIVEQDKSYTYYIRESDGCLAIYPKNDLSNGFALNMTERNKFFLWLQEKGGKIESETPDECNLYKGLDIKFSCNGKKYNWKRNGTIQNITDNNINVDKKILLQDLGFTGK